MSKKACETIIICLLLIMAVLFTVSFNQYREISVLEKRLERGHQEYIMLIQEMQILHTSIEELRNLLNPQ